MSLSSRNPVRFGGMGFWSGSVNTGQLQTTPGGQQVYTSFSGVGADTQIFAGAGRLDGGIQLTAATSGRTVVFYDGAVATSGGPFSASGHKIVGFLPAQQPPANSGQVNILNGVPFVWGYPFFSGLNAAAVGGSGGPSFTVTYTPEGSGLATP